MPESRDQAAAPIAGLQRRRQRRRQDPDSAPRRHALLACMGLLLACALGLPLTAPGAPADTATSSHTPAPGSPERRALLDALRAELRRWQGLDAIFVVDWMKVANGWAWAQVRPQSRDGLSHYEDVSALLRFEQGHWRVLELVGPEDDEVQRRFPAAPPSIFPAP